MNNFFEVNLPQQAPTYLVGQKLKTDFETAVRNITRRTQILNEALAISGIEPNKFHELAKYLFDRDPEFFDTYTPMDVAMLTAGMNDGKPVAVTRLDWPHATVLFDTAFTSTREWEALRHIGIGGSESSVVMGFSPYQTRRKLFHDKIGTVMAQPGSGTPVFERGHIIEPKVVEAFCRENGAVRVPETRMFASKRYPNSTANIDAIIRMPSGKLYVFEAKTAVEGSKINWINDKVPRHYLSQTHQYPAVLDDDRIEGTYISCFFVIDYTCADYFISASYDELSAITHFVERDAAYEEMLMEEEAEFWQEYILTGIEPEIDGEPDRELELVRSLHGEPRPEDPAAVLSSRLTPDIEEWLKLDDERKSFDKKSKAVKSQQDLLRAKILDQLGTSPEGRVDIDGTQEFYVISQSHAKSHLKLNDDLLDALYPEAAAAFRAEEERCKTFEALKAFPDAYDACVADAPGALKFDIKRMTEAEYSRKKKIARK